MVKERGGEEEGGRKGREEWKKWKRGDDDPLSFPQSGQAPFNVDWSGGALIYVPY